MQRPSAMSFGSYQQFCEQRRHMLAAAAAANDATCSFDIQLPSRYPAVGSTTSPRLPAANFYGAAPGPNMQTPRAGMSASQLPSSFFTSQDPAGQPLPGNSNIYQYHHHCHHHGSLCQNGNSENIPVKRERFRYVCRVPMGPESPENS